VAHFVVELGSHDFISHFPPQRAQRALAVAFVEKEQE
jgi:hypothetical protein